MASQTITGQDLQYTQDNKRCFAYSGTVAVDALEEVLSFTTNSEYIVGRFELHGVFSQIGANQIRIKVTINEVIVIDTYFDASLDSSIFDFPTKLIFPPASSVSIQVGQASGSNKEMQLTLTGRVYEYLPVRN